MTTHARSRQTPALSLVLALGFLTLFSAGASAVPSMARQTGYECARCHTVFPELTPFGRQFKLSAYTGTSKSWDERPAYQRLPVAAGLQVSQSNTSNTTAGGTTADDFAPDREPVLQQIALYYAGQITQNSGALAQFNYDGVEKRWAAEMMDIRYARGFSLGGKESTLGLTLNNNPSVTDIYNGTPAWGLPHSGGTAPQMPASTMVDMGLASQVGGVTAYLMWNDLVYVEAGAYRSARSGVFRFLGAGKPTEVVVSGNSPYWRIALQREAGKHSYEIGAFGLRTKVLLDGSNAALGENSFNDVAADASYQFISGDHTFSAHALWIRETQRWDASFAQELTSNASDSLTTTRADVHYGWKRRWGGNLQYFRATGSRDDLLYNTGDMLMGSSNGSPDTRGWVVEGNYLPTDRIKIAARYTAFQSYNGASSNYVPGRNASDNNNVFVIAWVLF